MRRRVAECRDLHRTYLRGDTEVHAVRSVNLSIHEADYVAVVGPSGSGKSTLLNLLGGIDLPTAGRVQLLGHDTRKLSDRHLTRLRLTKLGFVFQRFHLLPALTAEENVELPMAEAGVPGRERRLRARELLEYVGLGHRLDHRPGQLSGGEMQRVGIARALANQPELILADEPTGELDRETGGEIAELFRRLNRDGTTLVVVTHDEALAGAATAVYRMRDGRLEPAESDAGRSSLSGGRPGNGGQVGDR